MRLFLMVFSVDLMLAGACSAAGEAGFLIHAGEWENSVEQEAGQPPKVTLICRKSDQTMTSAKMSAMMSRMAVRCDAPVISDDGTTLSLAMTCDIAGGKLTTNSVITRDAPDAITSHTVSHMVGESFKLPDMSMVQHSRRLGPCQPGDKPAPDLDRAEKH